MSNPLDRVEVLQEAKDETVQRDQEIVSLQVAQRVTSEIMKVRILILMLLLLMMKNSNLLCLNHLKYRI